MKLNLRAVDNDHLHARDLARQRVAEWKSNAQREGLPIANQVDSGAPLLRRDEIVERSYPTYVPTVIKRSLWAKLFRWR